MKLQLKKFDMSSIAPDKVVVMIGKRNTGKSFLVKDLLWYHQKIPVGTVISATESANCFYGNMVPPIFIHNEYNEDIDICQIPIFMSDLQGDVQEGDCIGLYCNDINGICNPVFLQKKNLIGTYICNEGPCLPAIISAYSSCI